MRFLQKREGFFEDERRFHNLPKNEEPPSSTIFEVGRTKNPHLPPSRAEDRRTPFPPLFFFRPPPSTKGHQLLPATLSVRSSTSKMGPEIVIDPLRIRRSGAGRGRMGRNKKSVRARRRLFRLPSRPSKTTVLNDLRQHGQTNLHKAGRFQNPDIPQAGRDGKAHGGTGRRSRDGQDGTPTGRFAQEATSFLAP